MKKKIPFILIVFLLNLACAVPILSQNDTTSSEWLGESLVWNDEEGIQMTTVLEKTNIAPYSISENILTTPFTESNDSIEGTTSGNFSFVWHESSVRYGSWNFDIFLSNQQSSLTFFQIFPIAGISTGEWSQAGMSQNDINRDFKLFSICIIQGNYDSWAGNQSEWRFILRSFDNTVWQIGTKSIGENNFNEWHHINITRSTQGVMTMLFDDNVIFANYAFNTHFVSDYFGVGAFDGVLKIDNVSVVDKIGDYSWSDNFDPKTGSNSIPFGNIFIISETFLVIGLIRHLIKKKRL